MTRLETIKKIEELEQNKVDILKVINDIKSIHHVNTELNFKIESRVFHKSYNNENVFVNKDNLLTFLLDEVSLLNTQVDNLIKLL